jgi:16S rRNA processing protein RimM
MDQENLILLGYAAKAHGLKGHAIFVLPSGSETHLEAGDKVWLIPQKGSLLTREGAEFEIEEIHKGNDLRVKLVGVPDRTALEKILPFEIFCDREQFPELEEGQYYVADMLGLTVVTVDGKSIGKLQDYYETKAGIIFIIRFNNGTEMDLPYVSDFFPEVDLEAGTIQVVLPEVIE